MEDVFQTHKRGCGWMAVGASETVLDLEVEVVSRCRHPSLRRSAMSSNRDFSSSGTWERTKSFMAETGNQHVAGG